MAEKAQRATARAKILPYLAKRSGEVVFLAEVATETGLTERQVQQGVNNARHDSEEWKRSIEVIQAGQAWRYRPAGNSNTRMFEEVAVTKTGVLIIQDEEGRIYRAEELS